jgi:tetratricopeptide (TPR) repeat protein
MEVTFKEELKKVKDSVDKKTHGLKEAYLSISEQIYPMEQDVLEKLMERDEHGALRVVDKALQTLDVLNSDYPNDIKVQTHRAYMLKNRAMVMQRLNQTDESNKCLDEAARMFQSILENNPKDAGSWNGLGSVYILKGDLETALIYIDKALKIQPVYEAAKHDRELVIEMLRQRKGK